jgi:two-component system response regulator FixJ
MTARALILVVDDDAAVRLSLQALLENSGYRVKAYAGARACLNQADEGAACVIADMRMPGMDGLAFQAALVQTRPALPVIFVTGHGDVTLAVRGLKAGALDFIEKPFDAEILLAGVARAVAIGLAAGRKSANKTNALTQLALLSRRQRQVFDCLVTGRTSREAGLDLGISPRTVETHRRVVMQKLKAASVADLTRLSCAAPPD